MLPTSNLLDRKLSTYIVSPHGVTTAGNSNTFVVSKNMHVFCITFRRQTFFQDPNPGGHDHFRGIRNICFNYIDKKYSINQVIDKIIPDSFLTDAAKSAFAYYPPGSTIRNLTLSRDWNNITNIDGVFKIGDKYPIGIIKPNRIGQIDPSSGLPFHPHRDRVADDALSVDTPADAAITQAVKRWDLDNPANIHPLNNFPRKWLKINNLKSVFEIVSENGDREEEKIILVLSCAGATPGPPAYSTNERMITAQNLLEGNFRSDANPDKLCAVLFQNPNFKEDICYLLENNIRFNERLHIGIEKPIHYFNPEEDPLRFLYRSRKSFNSLLTQIPGRMGGVRPKYLIIKDHKISYCTRDEVLHIELPFIIIKIPDGYKKFLYSRDIEFVQFFQSFGDTGDQSLTAPIGMLQVPHIFANPMNIRVILEEPAQAVAAPVAGAPAPVAAAPVPEQAVPVVGPQPPAPSTTHLQLISEYHKKYLKYKQKYLQLKN